jgi:hypothetical protein
MTGNGTCPNTGKCFSSDSFHSLLTYNEPPCICRRFFLWHADDADDTDKPDYFDKLKSVISVKQTAFSTRITRVIRINTDYFDKSKSRISPKQKESVYIRIIRVIRVPILRNSVNTKQRLSIAFLISNGSAQSLIHSGITDANLYTANVHIA